MPLSPQTSCSMIYIQPNDFNLLWLLHEDKSPQPPLALSGKRLRWKDDCWPRRAAVLVVRKTEAFRKMKEHSRRKKAGRPKIRGRMSSLAAVFVQAIIPRKVDEGAQTELYQRFGIDPDECIYCGSQKTDDDHLRPIVEKGRSSGYFHTIENIVPACGPCNQSKSGAQWRKWMEGNAAKSPTRQNVSGLSERIARLAAFAGAAERPVIAPGEMRDVVGAELWDRYWDRLAKIDELIGQAQRDADEIAPILACEFELRLASVLTSRGVDKSE